jgi:biotin carboxyl carrier protein
VKVETVVNGRAGKLTIEVARFKYEPEGGNPIEREFSIEPVQPGAYSVLIDSRSYEVVISSGNEILVNGRVLSVEVFDPRGMRGRKNAGAAAGRQNITAPMPGKVVRLLVAPGDRVETGQGLIVVEAMKMQNEMKSPKDGRVAEVRIETGAAVSAGQVLVVIE